MNEEVKQEMTHEVAIHFINRVKEKIQYKATEKWKDAEPKKK